MRAPTCPYCGKKAELVSSVKVYGRDHGNLWICHPCQAWVGVHKNDGLNRPLGRLANAELRQWKRAAHRAFDPLWQRKIERDGCSKSQARKAGYTWLAAELGIQFDKCHIGMFDVDLCEKVVEVCSPERLAMISLGRKNGLPHDTSVDGEEGEPCRCWIENQSGELVLATVFDERTPEVCSQAAGLVIRRAS